MNRTLVGEVQALCTSTVLDQQTLELARSLELRSGAYRAPALPVELYQRNWRGDSNVSVRATHLSQRRILCSSVRMSAVLKVSAHKRRTRAEVQQLVAEFISSGMRRSEFCRSRRLSFGTLNRHLKKQISKSRNRAASSTSQLVPVELVAKESPGQHEQSCALAVVLSGGAGSKFSAILTRPRSSTC